MTNLDARIRHRLAALRKSARKASIDSGLHPDTISKVLKNPTNSPTLDTVKKMAAGLDTTPEWLAYGIGDLPKREEGFVTVPSDMLQAAVAFVLRAEGAPRDQAQLAGTIFLEALTRPTIAALDNDALRSFESAYLARSHKS